MIRRCLDISNITPANIRNGHSVAVVGKDTPPPPPPPPQPQPPFNSSLFYMFRQ